MRFRRVVGVLLAALVLTACDDWQRTSVQPVQATVVDKYSRRPGKVPRRYYVVIAYEGKQTRLRDRVAYQEKTVGDRYDACLVTYVRPERNETRVELEHCPAQ